MDAITALVAELRGGVRRPKRYDPRVQAGMHHPGKPDDSDEQR